MSASQSGNGERIPTLSLIIPVYNERDALPICLQRISAVIATLDITTELVFIDDGSHDGSTDYLIGYNAAKPPCSIIRFSRNFGKEAALTAGIDHARGEAVIILDADLQDPPELIPDMLEHWRQGVDVVLMQRRTREGESWLKRTSAHLYYRLLQRLSRASIPVDSGDFRLMSRRAVEALKRLPERNRYMKGLFAWVGMPTVVLQYDREARVAGKSKWNYFGLFQLAIEGITSFSTSPLRWTMFFGFLAALIGGLFGFWIMFKAMFFGDPARGYPSLVSVITFLGGVQLLAIGIVGEYVGKTYIESKQRPNYIVRDIIELPETRGPGDSDTED